jgi:hypothetical protein
MAPQAKEHDIEMGNAALVSKYVRYPETEDDNGKTGGKTNEHVCREDDHNYKSLERRFWVQVGITASVGAFCITMMAANSNMEGVYLPVLTGIMGYWLPAPDSRVKRPVQK